MPFRKNVVSILTWTGLFVVIGVIGYFIIRNHSNDATFSFWISLIGGYASLYGLVVMIIQFQSVRKTTEETKEKLESVSLISEWSRAIELIRSIEADIERDFFSVANYKLKNVKDLILKSKPILKADVENKELERVIKRINGYVDILSQFELKVDDPNSEINRPEMLSGLERIIDVMNGEINLYRNRI